MKLCRYRRFKSQWSLSYKSLVLTEAPINFKPFGIITNITHILKERASVISFFC